MKPFPTTCPEEKELTTARKKHPEFEAVTFFPGAGNTPKYYFTEATKKEKQGKE